MPSQIYEEKKTLINIEQTKEIEIEKNKTIFNLELILNCLQKS